MDGAGTWGTVCGHWLWDNDNAADIACRAQGFAAGSLYTYGATTALPVLPIVLGYRSCEGNEYNLFMCAQCGNRVQQNGCTSPVGCTDPTTLQPVCTPGADGSDHCCSWEGGQEEADSLQGCSHSIDQGVICYTQREVQEQTNQMNEAVPCEGPIGSCPEPAEQLEQCHGCGQGCSLADNGGQAIVFGCVDYWSAPCAYDASSNGGDYVAALNQFAQCAENPQSPAALGITRPNTFNCFGSTGLTCTTPDWNQRQGYCHGALRSAKYLSNQVVCVTGSNVAIGLHIRIPFRVNTAGAYTFRMHADYGLGSYFGVDGYMAPSWVSTSATAWSSGHVHYYECRFDEVPLREMNMIGDHEFEWLGFEDCCDGHASLEVQLPCDRATGDWRIVVAGESTCMDCNAQEATLASCSLQTCADFDCDSSTNSHPKIDAESITCEGELTGSRQCTEVLCCTTTACTTSMPGWPTNPPGGGWTQTTATGANLNCGYDVSSGQTLVPSSSPATIACANGQWAGPIGQQLPTCTLPGGGDGRRLLDTVGLHVDETLFLSEE